MQVGRDPIFNGIVIRTHILTLKLRASSHFYLVFIYNLINSRTGHLYTDYLPIGFLVTISFTYFFIMLVGRYLQNLPLNFLRFTLIKVRWVSAIQQHCHQQIFFIRIQIKHLLNYIFGQVSFSQTAFRRPSIRTTRR